MDVSWLNSGEGALWELLGASGRGTSGEWMVLGAAVLTLVLVFGRISRMKDTAANGPMISLLAAGVGLGCLVGSWLLVSGWLIPITGVRVPAPVERTVAILLSLVLAVPLMSLILRAKFDDMLMAWGLGLVAALLVMWLGQMGLEVAASGSSGAERTKARSAEMQDFLNRQ